MGVVSRRWVWLVGVGGIYGCGYWVESMGVATGCTTYPYSSCICTFLQQQPYFFCSFFKMFFVLVCSLGI